VANRRVTPSELVANPANFLALGAGTGLAPVAPGTFGTLGAIVVLLVMPSNWMIYAAVVAVSLFDILKPWPIGLIDKKVDGGMGIMLDDVIAGVFAAVSIQLILYVLGVFGVSLSVLGL